MIRRVRRLARIFVQFELLNLRIHMEYRVDFLVGVVAVLLMQGSGFLFIWALFEQVAAVGGWTFWEIALLYALSIIPAGLVNLFADGPWDLRQLVNTGEFDRLLVRPLPPALQVVTRISSLHGLGNLILGIVVLVRAVLALDPGWHAGHVLFLLLSVASGAILIGSVSLAANSIVFWEPAATGTFPFLAVNLLELNKFPVSLYDRLIRLALTWVLPFAFISYYPALVLLDKPLDRPWLGYASPLAGLLVAVVTGVIWRRGLRRYQGAGH